MSFLDAEFTSENFQSYANAFREIKDTIEFLSPEDYGFIVMPSRGAYPFMIGAIDYWNMENKRKLDSKARLVGSREIINSAAYRQLALPFTSDLGDSITGITTLMIRRHWVRVLAAIIRNDRNDPNWAFHDFIRRSVCPIMINQHVEDYCKTEKFLFLDTVVSGQSIFEISTCMEAEGLCACHYILIIDENGEKLHAKYKKHIDHMASQGRATRIYVKKLFTEDRGPALSGIWTAVMPELMKIALNEIPHLANLSAVGAAVSYCEVRKRDDDSNKAFTIANARISQAFFVASNFIDDSNTLENFLIKLREHLNQEKLLRTDATVKVAHPKLIASMRDISRLDVSRSHVLRAHITPDKASKIIKCFKAERGI